ncbi:MAG: hypothetical protein RSE17_00960 [Bacilli bacterium]
MKKVPKMISTKDASYIKDIFNWNIIAFKKYNYYISITNDEETIKLFNEASKMHYDICELLINILESGEELE